MDIHEYQAKELLSQYGVATPTGKVAFHQDEAHQIAKDLNVERFVVKAQIHAGGRGKGGGVKLATTLDGKVKMKVPAGTQSGKVFRLKGKGIPHLHGGGRGDQHVRVSVETPTGLNDRQRQLLEQFAEATGESVSPQSKTFFDQVRKLFG